MANYDSGHYFFTALIPLREEAVEIDGRHVSPRQRVEELLAVLPNAEWLTGEPAAPGAVPPAAFSPCSLSPFAREPRTHFTRLVVIDDLPYNGRQPQDSLVDLVLKRDPLVPQPVEHLGCAWLLWCADFDADSGAASERDNWARSVWQHLGRDLAPILQHAVGFESVQDADGFAAYLARCQVETTLPFNDYWAVMPPLADVGLRLPLIVAVIGLAMLPWPGWRLPGLLAVLAGVLWLWLAIRRAAARPFPPPQSPAPPSTLPSVLKALHVQQGFAHLVDELQGLDDAAVHARFGAFLDSERPASVDAPTQMPGSLGLRGLR